MPNFMGIFMSYLPKPLTEYCHVTLPWIQISKIFIFCLTLYHIIEKVTKFGGNLLKNEKLQEKKQIGVGKHPPPSPVVIGLKKDTVAVAVTSLK